MSAIDWKCVAASKQARLAYSPLYKKEAYSLCLSECEFSFESSQNTIIHLQFWYALSCLWDPRMKTSLLCKLLYSAETCPKLNTSYKTNKPIQLPTPLTLMKYYGFSFTQQIAELKWCVCYKLEKCSTPLFIKRKCVNTWNSMLVSGAVLRKSAKEHLPESFSTRNKYCMLLQGFLNGMK